MKEKIIKKIQMHQLVAGILEKNHSKFDSVQELKKAYEHFTSLNKNGSKLKQEFEKDIQPVLDKKAKAKEFLVGLANPVANMLQVYAFDLKDKSLAKKIDFSRNKLVKSKDSALVEKCELIWKTAKNIYGKSIEAKDDKKDKVFNISSYGITGTLIDDLEKANRSFIDSILTVKDAISQKNKSRKLLTANIKEIDDVLRHKIDKLMTVFELKDSSVYAEYKSLRIIEKEKPEVKKAEKAEEVKTETQSDVTSGEILENAEKAKAKKAAPAKINK